MSRYGKADEMAEEELLALPEANSFIYRFIDEEVGGKTVRRVEKPTNSGFVLRITDGDYVLFRDSTGRCWQTGYGPDGKQYREEIYDPQ